MVLTKIFFYSYSNEGAASNSRLEVPTKQNQRNDLEREILTALFDAPEREAEYALPKRKVAAVRRSGTFGKPVTAPPHDPSEVNKTTAVQQQLQNEHGMPGVTGSGVWELMNYFFFFFALIIDELLVRKLL